MLVCCGLQDTSKSLFGVVALEADKGLSGGNYSIHLDMSASPKTKKAFTIG